MTGTRVPLALRLYRAVMGIPAQRLASPTVPAATWADAGRRAVRAPDRPVPPLRDVLYYAYQKGFWPFLRGLLLRPRMRGCGGRLFLGRNGRILFPGHLAVGWNVAIGDHVYMNCYGQRGVVLHDGVRIREFGWIQVTSHLTHPGLGLEIGANTYVGPHSVLGAGGGIRIGRDVTLGAYVQLLAEDHGFAEPSVPINEQGVTRQGIEIGDDCWLGNSVIVLDGVRIGAGCVVGAGAVVTRDVAAGSVAIGNPARVVRTVERHRSGEAA